MNTVEHLPAEEPDIFNWPLMETKREFRKQGGTICQDRWSEKMTSYECLSCPVASEGVNI